MKKKQYLNKVAKRKHQDTPSLGPRSAVESLRRALMLSFLLVFKGFFFTSSTANFDVEFGGSGAAGTI